ncbi:hypothetical protein B2K_38740 [Paenibacillus mucilaginosus K02]|uniref:Uncharacterized protein n=1 Tax=Paenibacillus mucilaginosus K02 TaxID=997761 RepID=R9UL84_9BACL|nr:hypothetical protein B2K_38740 [Paenibacillus mucilaginosus K02]
MTEQKGVQLVLAGLFTLLLIKAINSVARVFIKVLLPFQPNL